MTVDRASAIAALVLAFAWVLDTIIHKPAQKAQIYLKLEQARTPQTMHRASNQALHGQPIGLASVQSILELLQSDLQRLSNLEPLAIRTHLLDI